MSPAGVSYAVAFLAGLTFFFSPCVWPMYPSYLGYIAGAGAGQLAGRGAGGRVAAAGRARILGRALAFVLGFSLVFIALGATASSFGQLLLANLPRLRKVAGVLIAFFGLAMTGWLRIPLLERSWQPLAEEGAAPGRAGSWLGALALGGAFSIGWTPCVGPVLAAILLYASTQASLARGVALLATYSAGMGVPFLVLAAGFEWLWPRLAGLRPFLPAVQKAAGLLLVLLGVLVYTDWLTQISFRLFYLFS
ncbi:MAG: cytochrome c biogenesis protein CcdA [Bacillota bacterium]|nr:cytochrome c biogenesis protein CcdA [Bacillota bacterium]